MGAIQDLTGQLRRTIRVEAIIEAAVERGWDADRIDWLLFMDDIHAYRGLDADLLPAHRELLRRSANHLLAPLLRAQPPADGGRAIPDLPAEGEHAIPEPPAEGQQLAPSPSAPSTSEPFTGLLQLDSRQVAALEDESRISAELLASASAQAGS